MTTPPSCPYCGVVFRGKNPRGRLRVHVATNDCGHVPHQVVVEFARDDPAGETTDLLPTVTKVAEANGWRVCHVFPSRGRDGRWLTSTSSPGFPDVWMVRPGQLVVLELKGRKGRPEDGQAEWIADLDSVAGVTARFAGPDDWPAVQRLLSTADNRGTVPHTTDVAPTQENPP